MEVVVTIGAISRAKLQPNHHHQQTNIQFFLQAGCPSCRPTNSFKALKGTISHSMDLLTPSSPGGFPTFTIQVLCRIISQKFKHSSISFAGMSPCYRCQHQCKKSRKTWNNLQWLCQMVKLPCNALKPCSGTRELPVTNCSSRARRSSSYSSTARQNQRTMFVSSEQCFNRLCRFQSSMSILPRPPIISCTTNNDHTHLWNWGSYIYT